MSHDPRFRLPFLRRGHRSDGEPALPQVRTDFEGGNAAAITVVSPAHVRFSAHAHSSPRPLWFYLCIEGTTAPAVRCELRNADQCLGPRLGWKHARPVFSSDGRHWQRVARAEYVEEATDFGYFTFTVPVVGRRTYVAYCYPYTTADLEILLQTLGGQRFELCRSAEDRVVPYVRLGNHENPKRAIWVLARQHAGETPSSYVAEGLIRTLHGGQLASLAETAYHVVPMVDVDGVYHGRYGKDQEPVDFNRDWRDHPVRHEIISLLRAIRASQEQASISMILDLHASHHGDTRCYAFGTPDTEAEKWEPTERLLVSLEKEGPETVGFQKNDFRCDYHPERTAREYLGRALEVPALTLEISYHQAQSGRWLTQRDYRDFGSALARSLDRLAGV